MAWMPTLMTAKPVILIADAGPLITLAYAEALDLMLLPGWSVQMVDMVVHEVTRNQTATSEKIAQWLQKQQLFVHQTRIFQAYSEARSRGENPSKSNLGERAVQEIMNEFALQYPVPTGVFLFEDHKIAKSSFLLPEQSFKITTRAFLQYLQERTLIASAAEIERKAIKAGRSFSELSFRSDGNS